MGLSSNLSAGTSDFESLQQACHLQDDLMVTFLSMVTRSSGKLLLRSMLRQTLEGLAKLTLSEESSFFWLDEQGYVTESILARGITIREQKETVVGQVLESGLAGWVYRNRRIGVIKDTATDERWLELPYQPYVAKSIVCFPIIRGTRLLAIATLMHSEVGFFDDAGVALIELCAQKLALVLDLLRIQEQMAGGQVAAKEETPKLPSFASISQLILSDDGQLLSADPRLAEIFHYETHELAELGSFFDLVTETHQDVFAKKVAQCFEGQQTQLLVTFRGVTKDNQSLRIEFYGHRERLFDRWVMVARLRVV